MILIRSRSHVRWNASMASARPRAVWSTSGTWRQNATGGRSTGRRAQPGRALAWSWPVSLSFLSRGTFRPRYGLNVRGGDAADAPELLDRLRAGDARAFEELVASHQHRVFGVALRMLGSAAEAEEVAQ